MFVLFVPTPLGPSGVDLRHFSLLISNQSPFHAAGQVTPADEYRKPLQQQMTQMFSSVSGVIIVILVSNLMGQAFA